jgi:hypothetical protein
MYEQDALDGEIMKMRRNGAGTQKMATILGVPRTTVRNRLARMARSGCAAELTPGQNPPGFQTGKVTVQYAADGTVEREWRRVHPEEDNATEWVNELIARAGKAGPKLKAKVKPSKNPRLLEIPIGDLHLGMYAWAKETGNDYDADRAADLFYAGCHNLFDQATDAHDLVLADLGDFLHADNRHGVTERGGNILDTDTRWHRVIGKARDAWVAVVEEAAERFRSVKVIMTPGNHNHHSTYWMQMVIASWFRNCKHVTICQDAATYRYHQWQSVLLGYAHGHLLKASNLASIMARDEAAAWAKTTHRHWRCGHIHHSVREVYRDRDESDGVTVEYFPTLAGRDAYHAEHGYLSRRLLQGIVYDAQDGEVRRHTVHARMIER